MGGKGNLNGPDEVKQELKRLGHDVFMSFSGMNIAGKYAPMLDAHLKLMYIAKHDMAGRLVKKEPPTLLFESMY
ncbi:MAG: hypothetical protein AB1796_05245 [Bacillota bacterium]